MAASKPTSPLSEVEDTLPHLTRIPFERHSKGTSIDFWDLNPELVSLPFGYRAYPVPSLLPSTVVRDSEFDKVTGD